MQHKDFEDQISNLAAEYVGHTVILLDDEPTGVGYYGEKGMKADVVGLKASPEEDGQYIVLTLDYAPYREHNIECEQPVWYTRGDAVTTATDAGKVEDRVEMGIESVKELRSFIKLAEPNPVHDEWRQNGGGETYVRWLEGIAARTLELEALAVQTTTPEI